MYNNTPPSRQSATSSLEARQPLVDAVRTAKMERRCDDAMCAGPDIKDADRLDHYHYGDIYGEAKEFVEGTAVSIIESAAAKAGAAMDVDALAAKLADSNPLLATELLLAINSTGRVVELSEPKFLQSLERLDFSVACSLLFEIRMTGNADALADSRIFSDNSVSFLNELGKEAASEWFGAIGRTKNVNLLTSASAMSNHVLDYLDHDANLASKLSYALGQTGSLSLVGHQFLDALSLLPKAEQAEFISAVWTTGKVGLATAEVVQKIVAGGDVWPQFESGVKATVVIARLSAAGDEHDLGSLLAAKSMIDAGYGIRYIAHAASHDEVLKVARSSGALAIAFSIMDESQGHVASSTAMQLKLEGSSVTVFGGGFISSGAATAMAASGVKMFADVPSLISSEYIHMLATRQMRPDGVAYTVQTTPTSVQAGVLAWAMNVGTYASNWADSVTMSLFRYLEDDDYKKQRMLEQQLAKSTKVAEKLERIAAAYHIDLRYVAAKQQADYYASLGVTRTAAPNEIRLAYLLAARQYHPDVNKTHDTTQKMAEINEAYATLGKAGLRKEYDKLHPPLREAAWLAPTAERILSAKLTRMYSELREADVKEFTRKTSAPLPRKELLAAIATVGDWESRLNKAADILFREFKADGKNLKRLQRENFNLLKKTTDVPAKIRLLANQRMLEDLALGHIRACKGIDTVTRNIRQVIMRKERRVMTRLYASIG